MQKRLYQGGIVVLGIAILFLFANCSGGPDLVVPGKVTGGGWVEAPNGKANFGFNASSCDGPENITGRFNFHDKTASLFPNGGVKMNGAVIDAMQCAEQAGCEDPVAPGQICPMDAYSITVGYRSTNPKYPGTGIAGACVVDYGEGKNGTGVLLGLGVQSGPFLGYSISGTIKGNIQAHLCPAP